MKLLLDENLSDRIVDQILDLYPGSSHVKAQGLTNTDDVLIWSFAQHQGFVIDSKDADFHQRSLLYGAPPKFIFPRVGNCPNRPHRWIAAFRALHHLFVPFRFRSTAPHLTFALTGYHE